MKPPFSQKSKARNEPAWLTAEKRQQFQSAVDRHVGFLNGTSLTFPQIHSGEIVDTFKMAGFKVHQPPQCQDC